MGLLDTLSPLADSFMSTASIDPSLKNQPMQNQEPVQDQSQGDTGKGFIANVSNWMNHHPAFTRAIVGGVVNGLINEDPRAGLAGGIVHYYKEVQRQDEMKSTNDARENAIKKIYLQDQLMSERANKTYQNQKSLSDDRITNQNEMQKKLFEQQWALQKDRQKFSAYLASQRKANTGQSLEDLLVKQTYLNALYQQSQGKAYLASSLDQKTLDSLPDQAKFQIGLPGLVQIDMVKKPKALSAESATKLSNLIEAQNGAQSIINDIGSGKVSNSTLSTAVIPGLKHIPGVQSYAAKFKLMSESMGRALSGAAIPKHEIESFQDLYTVHPTDTMEVKSMKLARFKRISNRISNEIKYGSSLNEEGILDTNTANNIINEELNRTKNDWKRKEKKK